MKGWVKLWRKLEQSDVWSSSLLTRSVWIWILMHANHESKEWNGQILEAGEFITSYAKISKGVAWTENRKVVIPSAKRARTAVELLTNLGCLRAGYRQGGLWIKVLHWEQYQGSDDDDLGRVNDELGQVQGTNLGRNQGNKQEEKNKEVYISSEVRDIFVYWQTVMGKQRSRLTGDRRGKIEARLREGYSVDEIKKAIDGCRNTPWNMGENPNGKQYNDFDLICRNGSKLEQFIAAGDGPKTGLQVLRERWGQ